MEILAHRVWMYNRLNDDRCGLTNNFLEGLDHFMNFAIEYAPVESVKKLRYPCERCQNRNIVEYATVRVHLLKREFMPNYYY